MFTGFDFDVIARSLPYLWQGMVFSLGLTALSMAGVPMTLGFVGKDSAYEALLHAADWFPWLLAATVLASIFLGLTGLIAGLPTGNSSPGRVTTPTPWPPLM